ncbi:MAG: hypothetical protein Q4C01_05655 [Clostridia bacterium]|nr:hypothetical protein [Clostridia bacterium]
MKKLILLVKLQLSSLFGRAVIPKKDGDPTRRRKQRSNFATMLVTGILLLAMSFMYSYGMAAGLKPLNALDSLLSVMMVASTMLILISAIARAKTVLYTFGDYDQMMSLPIPPRVVAVSRLISYYVFDLLFAVALLIPCGIIYGIYQNPAWTFYPMLIVLTLFVPLLPLAIGGFLGTLLAAATARFKYKNALSTIMQMALLILVMVLSFTLQGSEEMLSSAAMAIADRVEGIYPLAGMFSSALHGGEVLQGLAFIGISAAFGLLFSAFTIKFFKPLCTRMRAVYRNRNFRLTRQSKRSLLGSLYLREWKHYTSSTLYFINTGFGSILLALAILYLAFFGRNTLQPLADVLLLSGYESFFAPVIASVLAWLLCLCPPTAACISIEGKNLWLSKHLPIPAGTWIRSKILVSLTLPVPISLITVAALTLSLRLPAAVAIGTLAILLPYIYFFTVVGLWINLRNNRFDWKNEAEIVKAGAPVLIMILVTMAATVLPAVFTISTELPWLCYVAAAAFLIAAIVLRAKIEKRAEDIRRKL